MFLLSSFDLLGQAPQFKWVKKIPFEIKSQCVDNEDNIYITGDYRGSVIFENDTLTVTPPVLSLRNLIVREIYYGTNNLGAPKKTEV